MILTAEFSRDCDSTRPPSYWQRIFSEEELQSCAPLEKLLVGCEIIVALDAVELLAA